MSEVAAETDTVQVSPADAAKPASVAERVAKYLGVNVLSTILDCTLFLVLVKMWHLPTTMSIIAYTVSIVLNYQLSKRFVFKTGPSQKSERRRFAEFMATGALGLVLTAAITWVATAEFAMTPAHAKGLSLIACLVVLYYVRSRLVFRD